MASGQSRPIDRILNIAVSAAAVPVLLGALFKITHAPGADLWLKIGLYTEAGIFLAYALLYVIAPPPEGPAVATAVAAVDKGNPALKSMEKMLQDAEITPANLQKLSSGFQKLGATVNDLGEIGNVVAATGDFTNETKKATAELSKVKDAYSNAAATLSSFNSASDSTKQYHEQVQVMTKNLSSLNTIYEMELQESNNHLKSLNAFYGKLNQAAAAMSTTADDAQKAKEQIAALATNLGRLNQVYGNMLSAMAGGK